MIIVATDAPLLSRNLERLAARALLGLARTGSVMDTGSGDYVIAFSTHSRVRRAFGPRRNDTFPALRYDLTELANDEMSQLFQGVVEATEEAIYNSLFTATTERAHGNVVEALPVDEVLRILRERRAIR